MLLSAVEADIFDAETTGQGLLLWRLLMIAFVEFGAAKRVTTDDEKVVTILVTAVKLVDVGTICWEPRNTVPTLMSAIMKAWETLSMMLTAHGLAAI